jgi:hypothetical protein
MIRDFQLPDIFSCLHRIALLQKTPPGYTSVSIFS